METYIVTVDGTAYEVTVQKKSQLQKLFFYSQVSFV